MSAIQIVGVSIEEFYSNLASLVRTVVKEEQKTSDRTNHESKKYLTRKDVARILQIDLSTVNNWKKSGKLKAYQIGGRILFLESELPESLKAIRPLQ